MEQKIDCPVDFVPVDENKIRLIAAGICLLSVAIVWTGRIEFSLFLLLDFFFRAFQLNAFSPIGKLAQLILNKTSFEPQWIDQAPKRFAAKIGFVLCILALLFFAFQLKYLALSLIATLAVFSFLEGAFSFCAGCLVYTFLKKWKWIG